MFAASIIFRVILYEISCSAVWVPMQRLLILLALLALTAPLAPPVAAQQPGDESVQAFLDRQPGVLKGYRDGDQTAAMLIDSQCDYYGLSSRLILALLEATNGLLSNPAPPTSALEQPFGRSGPQGFAAQIEWATRELRAGLGPYERSPIARFSDGSSLQLDVQQAPEGIAVQRFLAQGRTQPEWRAAVERFARAFAQYYNNQLPAPAAQALPLPLGGFLRQPWPAGTRVQHLAFFDHAYPTVDSGDDGNGYVVDYLGRSGVQYDGHDGHDYVFLDQPIGTPILAAAPGVAYARTVRGNGVVILHDGGYETVYWHLDRARGGRRFDRYQRALGLCGRHAAPALRGTPPRSPGRSVWLVWQRPRPVFALCGLRPQHLALERRAARQL
jgi:murein DD-endopeptidase MepM/ murein hydrolase activator NlpD